MTNFSIRYTTLLTAFLILTMPVYMAIKFHSPAILFLESPLVAFAGAAIFEAVDKHTKEVQDKRNEQS